MIHFEKYSYYNITAFPRKHRHGDIDTIRLILGEWSNSPMALYAREYGMLNRIHLFKIIKFQLNLAYKTLYKVFLCLIDNNGFYGPMKTFSSGFGQSCAAKYSSGGNRTLL